LNKSADATEAFDIAIVGGELLTISNDMSKISDSFIGISDGKIKLVCSAKEMRGSVFFAKKTINANNMVVMPGFVNTHAHLAMSCFRGIADDMPLMKWLHESIFPLEKQFVDYDMVYYGSLLSMAEMLLAGITTCADSYFFEEAIVKAGIEAKIRLIVGKGFFDPPNIDSVVVEKIIAIAEKFVTRCGNISDLIVPAIFCHSPYSCSPQVMKALKNVARENDILFMLHLLESADENKIVFDRYGQSPVELLLVNDILDKKTVAVHGVYLNANEIDIFAEHEVKVSHNPQSNMKLACGVAPIARMKKANICVGIGTDGATSNNRLDMFSEMSTTAKLHKVSALDATILPAQDIVRMATIDGAKVLGIDSLVGSIEVGKLADIIIVDFNAPHLTPVYDYYSHLVYCAKASDVYATIVNGSIVVFNNEVKTFDVASVINNVNKLKNVITSHYSV